VVVWLDIEVAVVGEVVVVEEILVADLVLLLLVAGDAGGHGLAALLLVLPRTMGPTDLEVAFIVDVLAWIRHDQTREQVKCHM